MLGFLPRPVLGGVIFSLMVLNTIFFASLVLLLTPFRLLLPGQSLQNRITELMMQLAATWCSVNTGIYGLLPPIKWDISYPPGLKLDGWYFVIANHQSWVDILVLFHTFNRRIPFLKYFLKQELIWIPFMGLAVYAMDFPFMKRHAPAALKKHPELRGQDLETTRRACAKFKHTPVSVINFLEGTRFTPAKHDEQQSSYQHLLKPKAGGMAFVLSALGEQMHQMLDVTIVYPGEPPRFWDFVCGRVRHIIVRVQARDIPPACFAGDYEGDPAFRGEFQAWIGQLWQDKDALLNQYHSKETA